MTILRQQAILEPHVELSDVGVPQSFVFNVPGVLGGSLLVLMISENDPTGPGVTGVTDDVSGAWTLGARLDFPQFGWQVDASVWYLRHAAGGAHVVTVDFAASTDWSFAAIVGAEYAGVAGPFLGIVAHPNPGVNSWSTLPVRSSGSLTVGDRALFVAGFCDFGGQNYYPSGGSLGAQGSNLIPDNDSVFTLDVSGYQGGWVDLGSGVNYPGTITREVPPVAPLSGATHAMRIHASDPHDNGGASTRRTHAIAVSPGNRYTLEADLLGDAAGDSAEVTLLFLDADGNFLGVGPDFFAGLDNTSWNHRVSVGVQAPFGAATALLQFTTFSIWDGTTSNAHDMWVTNIVLLEMPFTWEWGQAALAVHDGDADAALFDRGVGTDGIPLATTAEARVAIDGGSNDVAGFIAAFGVEPGPSDPLPPPPAGRKWQFFDPSNGDIATFLINPQDGGSPGYQKQFSAEITTVGSTGGGTGAPLVFETADQATEMSASGTIIDEAEYNMFATWFERQHPIVIIDDLGRNLLVVLKTFKPKRVWSGTVPWRHTYDISALVLRQT